MYLRTFGLLALYLFGFAACDYPYDPNADDLEATGTEVLLTTGGGSIDFGSLALPSTPFTLEARVLWTVPSGLNTSQTFWFYGTPTNYVWIGGIQTASSTASPLYVVVNNGTALSANAAGTVVRPARSTWIFFSVAFTSTDIKFNVIGWNPSGLSSTLSNNTFSIPFDSSAVPSSGRRHLFGDAPDSVKNQTRVLLSAASSASFPGSVDELRIFNSSRSFDDFYTSCIARLAADTPNIYALWTIEEEAGAVILTDKVASRNATVNGTVQAQSSYVMVTNLNYILNPSQSLSVPVRTFSSTTDSYNVTRTTPNTTVSVCYQRNSICYPFPVSLPTFTLATANPIIFTPLRTSCNSTVVNTFVPVPSSQNPFTVTIKYLPYTFTVNEPSANVSSTGGSIVKLTGSFGLGYEDMSLDNVAEFVQFTGDSSGTTKSNLPVTINSTGMFITFGQGYGVGQINMTLCRQNIILPAYYPPPSISSLLAYDFTYFEIQGSNFGDKTRTWATNAVVFVTNGTEAINCIVSESTDSSIKCTLEQNKALSLGQPVNITVNIGSIPTKYFISSFDPCNGSCKNGGKCVGLNTCDCSLTYYEGNECQTELSCLPNCTSNGICARINATDPETDTYCQCEDGYEGKSCSQKISSGSTPVALIAGVTVGGGVLILGLAAVVVILLIRSKNQRRGGKNFIPLHKKDFTKIIYGEQLNQDPEKTDADLDKLEQMLIEDNLEVAVAVSNITQITEADKIAKALVVVFQNSDKVLTLLQAFIAEEVNTTESAGTLFRSNSMVSKMFKFYSRLIGLPYLYETIGPELCELIEEELGLEVDPEKMEEGTDLDEMRWMLMAQSQKILKSVLNSVERCPPQFRTLFNHIKRCVADRFPENVNTTIGGFIFLRFFCPAVSSPEAYGIVDEPPSASARRLLILITKVLQNLSNDVEFGSKEPYMTKMNDFIHSNRQKLTEFYDKLVKPANKANVTCTLPKNMRAVSLAVIANHIKDNLGKVENATVKSRLESVFKS